MNNTLVLFTNQFPYGNSEPFLETEIEYLAKEFSWVILIPRKQAPGRRTIPENVEIKKIFLNTNKASRLKLYLRGIALLIMNYSLLNNINIPQNFHILGFTKSIKYLGLFSYLKKDLEIFLKSTPISFEKTIFYTYWLGHETFVLGLTKQKCHKLKIISRAHRYDLYEEWGEKSFTFIKKATLSMINQVYCISEHGRNYLLKKYPEFEKKISVFRLGTKDPGFILTSKNTQNFIIVSCSTIKKVKRLDRIIKALGAIEESQLKIKLEWHHIGDGTEKEPIKKIADKLIKSPHISWKLHGFVPNKELFDVYKKLNPDVFINVSESEGLPVSIMEAQSIGLPVIATDTGGTSEIINNKTGILLPAEHKIEDISRAILKLSNKKDFISEYKKAARSNWEKQFRAKTNYILFANELKTLINA